jgi:hypothetical protein
VVNCKKYGVNENRKAILSRGFVKGMLNADSTSPDIRGGGEG